MKPFTRSTTSWVRLEDEMHDVMSASWWWDARRHECVLRMRSTTSWVGLDDEKHAVMSVYWGSDARRHEWVWIIRMHNTTKIYLSLPSALFLTLRNKLTQVKKRSKVFSSRYAFIISSSKVLSQLEVLLSSVMWRFERCCAVTVHWTSGDVDVCLLWNGWHFIRALSVVKQVARHQSSVCCETGDTSRRIQCLVHE